LVLDRHDVPAGVVKLTVDAGVVLDDELDESPPPPQATRNKVMTKAVQITGIFLSLTLILFKN
jgi:hypothetical protein